MGRVLEVKAGRFTGGRCRVTAHGDGEYDGGIAIGRGATAVGKQLDGRNGKLRAAAGAASSDHRESCR